jgi:hypothetical protein
LYFCPVEFAPISSAYSWGDCEEWLPIGFRGKYDLLNLVNLWICFFLLWYPFV